MIQAMDAKLFQLFLKWDVLTPEINKNLLIQITKKAEADLFSFGKLTLSFIQIQTIKGFRLSPKSRDNLSALKSTKP